MFLSVGNCPIFYANLHLAMILQMGLRKDSLFQTRNTRYTHTPLRGRVAYFDTNWHCSRGSDVFYNNLVFSFGVGENFAITHPKFLFFVSSFRLSQYCNQKDFNLRLENFSKKPNVTLVHTPCYPLYAFPSHGMCSVRYIIRTSCGIWRSWHLSRAADGKNYSIIIR